MLLHNVRARAVCLGDGWRAWRQGVPSHRVLHSLNRRCIALDCGGPRSRDNGSDMGVVTSPSHGAQRRKSYRHLCKHELVNYNTYSEPSEIVSQSGRRACSDADAGKEWWAPLSTVFLPASYPSSVAEWYWPFQSRLLMQSVCVSTTYVFTTHALLTALGFAPGSAMALSASMSWVLKDGIGSLGAALYAHWSGTSMDTDPKPAKIRADMLVVLGTAVREEDMNIDVNRYHMRSFWMVEMVTPLVPILFLPLASLATMFKAVAGLAQGASRASIYKAATLRNNLGDVTAKGYAQSVCAYSAGTVLGISLALLANSVGSIALAVSSFIGLSVAQLFFGYTALRSVVVRTLNRGRLEILARDFEQNRIKLSNSGVRITPWHVNECESFLFDFSSKSPMHVGCPLGMLPLGGGEILALEREFESRQYMVFGNGSETWVCVRHGAASRDVLQAALYGVLLQRRLFQRFSLIQPGFDECLVEIHDLNRDIAAPNSLDHFMLSAERAGWDTTEHHIVDLGHRFRVMKE